MTMDGLIGELNAKLQIPAWGTLDDAINQPVISLHRRTKRSRREDLGEDSHASDLAVRGEKC
jgi:hypothetical protein